MSAQREMTLAEWCEQLHDGHRVNRELRELTARAEAAEQRVRELQVALCRWLPEIAGDDAESPMHSAATSDASLLIGLREQPECFGEQLWADARRYAWIRNNAFTVTVPAIDFDWQAEIDEHGPDYSLDRKIDAALTGSGSADNG